MKLNKKIIATIKEKIPNVSISDEGDYYEIYVDNPCCEDFTLEIDKGEDEIEELINSCDSFDAEEHTKLWWGQNRGEPSSLRDLLENSEDIENTLKELSMFLYYDVLNK